MARHTAVIHVDFESQDDGPEPEAIADEIARDIDAFLTHDSAYTAASSYLDDVRDAAPDTSPTGRWRIGFYALPPVEVSVEAHSRQDALGAFDALGYDQVELVYMHPGEDEDEKTEDEEANEPTGGPTP